MHGYYISVNKLQDELYLYRWRRGGETRKKQLGFGFQVKFTFFLTLSFMCCLYICIKYVYLYVYQLHYCVLPPLLHSFVKKTVSTFPCLYLYVLFVSSHRYECVCEFLCFVPVFKFSWPECLSASEAD